MAKLTLQDVQSGYNAMSVINANNALVEAALENTLSRDGTSPNGMDADLDMDSNEIINLGPPTTANSAARLVDVQDAFSVDIAPSQTGNEDKVLTTDGSSASWNKITDDNVDAVVGVSNTKIKYSTTAAETAALVTAVEYAYTEADLFRYFNSAQISDFQSASLSLDLTTKVQDWVTIAGNNKTAKRANMPRGNGKVTSAIDVPAGATLYGNGVHSRLSGFGCNVFNITGSFVHIEDMTLFGYTSGGSADPKTFDAIVIAGTSGTPISYNVCKNLYLQGWHRCIDWKYTLSSVLDNVRTINSNYGVRLYGQSVNNAISNSFLVVNSGTASIHTQKNGADQGEGLFVSNTLLASGANAVLSDGFLSMGFDASSMADLISGVAFDLTGVQVFKCDMQWVYAAGACFHFRDSGSAINTAASINIGRATTTGASSSLLIFAANNDGLFVQGGEFNKSGATGGTPFSLSGNGVAIDSAKVTNATTNPAYTVSGSNVRITNPLGDTEVEWNTSPIRSLASAATLSLPDPIAQIELISLTGNTGPITTINSAATWAGKTVVFKCSSTPTFTDGGNIKIAGDFVATADDTLTLISDGTSWYQVGSAAN